MGHSQAEKAQNHERILEAAADQIREAGLESLTVASLMKKADLTHGGFYGHFASRSALVTAALTRALNQAGERRRRRAKVMPEASFQSLVAGYLSREHRDDRKSGCPFASLAADVARSDDKKVRALMSERLEQAFARTAHLMESPKERTDEAVAAWSTMLGGLLLARVFGDGARSDEILSIARRAASDYERGDRAPKPDLS